MLSFRVDDEEAAEMRWWADHLGIDRSELLRDALHRRLVELKSVSDARRYGESPVTDDERALSEVAGWGPADDWSDWADAEG